MRLVPLVLIAALISACGGSSTFSRDTDEYNVSCPMGWSECDMKAREHCGERGYEEVKGLGSRGVTTAGRGTDSRSEEIFRRATRGESRTTEKYMTFRCK